MISLIAWVLVYLISLTMHEAFHALAANALGDPTAKRAGRLSLNPLSHIDPFWTILFPAMLYFSTGGHFAIGMAKPVPVDFGRLKDPKRGMIWVSLAGPLANFALAWGFHALFERTGYLMMLYAVYLNLGLAVFNLIPIPPLDGSRVLAGILPIKLIIPYMKFERYGFPIIFLLYLSGVLFKIMLPAMNVFCVWLGIPQLRL